MLRMYDPPRALWSKHGPCFEAEATIPSPVCTAVHVISSRCPYKTARGALDTIGTDVADDGATSHTATVASRLPVTCRQRQQVV